MGTTTRGVLIGLVIGFAVGATTVTLLRTEPETAETPRPEAGPGAARRPPPPDPLEGSSPSAPESGPEVPPDEIHRVANTERTYTPEEVSALVSRLDAALASGDLKVFNAALDGLCYSDSDIARRRLLDLFVDEGLPDLRGSRLVAAFHDSDLPGIASAARRRFEIHIAAGETSWVASSGWFDLVARHGDSQDIAWLLERKESGQTRSQALEAIAGSPTAAAVEAMERLFRENKAGTRQLRKFGNHHPERAFDLTCELMNSGAWSNESSDDNQLYAHLGRLVPAERVGEVRRLLFGLSDDRKRVAAVYAVQQLKKRGLDTAGFEQILEAPLRVLEGPDGAAGVTLRGKARYAVEYNSILWSERAADALERAGYKSEAARVRKELRGPFKTR